MPSITVTIDRGGRRRREYQRTTEGPGRRERSERKAAGEAWCRDCSCWHPARIMSGGLCPEHRREYARRRYETDPAYRERRRAHAQRRKRGVEPMPEIAKEILFETFRGQCAYCPEPAETWDHALAVSLGGLTEPGNMLPACKRCNSRKKNKPLERWLQEVPNLNPLTIEHLSLTWHALF